MRTLPKRNPSLTRRGYGYIRRTAFSGRRYLKKAVDFDALKRACYISSQPRRVGIGAESQLHNNASAYDQVHARCVGKCRLWKLELTGAREIAKTKDSLSDKSGVLHIMAPVNSSGGFNDCLWLDCLSALVRVLLLSLYCFLFRLRNSSVGKCPSNLCRSRSVSR